MDQAKIAANIKARKAGEELAELLVEEAGQHGDSADSFWRAVTKAIPRQYLVVERDLPMGDKEAERWETLTTLEFGKFKDLRVVSVPSDYLEWLDQQDDFRRQLNRYLRSDWVQDCQQTED